MRSLVVVTAGLVVVACTSTPGQTIVIDRPGDVIVVHDPGPDGGNAESSTPDAGTVDAADAAPITCKGPQATGMVGGTNCTPLGSCTMATCTVGEAYSCAGGVFPSANVGCFPSASDSKPGAPAFCCERTCVRHDVLDGDCAAMGPAIAHAYLCPTGMTPRPPPPPVTCHALAGSGDNAWCCP